MKSLLYRLLLICCLLPLGMVVADAQNSAGGKTVKITGTVIDNSKQPVVGASIMVKGDFNYGGAITDLDGKFSFTVPEGCVVVVSSIGYDVAEQKINSAGDYTITINEATELLDDAVVVGYGVQKKESVVGAISQVKGDALVNSGSVNITHTIAGKLSGVETFQKSGQPGNDEVTIVIRGQSSWNGEDPLVMVDGVERKFTDLDPNEVESISVLKDASATAVFGAKGANGVILVTTKTGLKGKPKLKLSVNYGFDNPTFIPEHVPGDQVLEMTNIAHKNQQTFASMYSAEDIKTMKDQSSPLRFPDNDWFGMMVTDFAQTLDANLTVSGGGERATYFVSIGYATDNSLVKRITMATGDSYISHKYNYRSNVDVKVTPTTTLSFKFGGSTSIKGKPQIATTDLFTQMYMASSVMFPAYYPEGTLNIVPDANYPDENGSRASSDQGAYTGNPYYYIIYDGYQTSAVNRLNTDAILRQDLGFITKGLSAQGKVAFTTEFLRYSKKGKRDYPKYNLDWNLYDQGFNPWTTSSQKEEVLTVSPYDESQDNTPASTSIVFYWEASLNYARKFGKHDVTALALMNQRESISGVAFPGRTESIVGRATYNYDKKYFLEANVGYTGSEQFSPKNRYGLFPSVAVGYTLSNEKFWKQAMPWWSKMKIRYSDGIVGSDAAKTKWLYFSAYSKSNGVYTEQSAANETARWETARKRDLGFEMGWFNDNLTLQVDLFDEHRTDMLVPPVVTPLVAVSYKDINAGELKKHGFEIEPKYRHTCPGGFYYEVGAMMGVNENRILAYPDLPSQPSYQWHVGTAHGSQRQGMEQVGNGFFNNIDELHAYPINFANWGYAYPGIYKFGDYNADSYIDTNDYHPISGMTYPMCTYSFNLGFSYKGFSFNTLFYGNYGKYSNFIMAYDTEYYKGDLTMHKAQVDYWTPTHNDSKSIHRIINFNTLFTSQVVGADYAFEDHTWMRSDFLSLREVYLAYKFDGDKLKKKVGMDGITVTLTGNNMFTWTGLIEGDPQLKTLNDSYYPIVRVVKLGLKFDF